MASRAAQPGAAKAPDDTLDVAQLPVANPGILVIGIMAASLLQVLDTTIANVAIPHMRTALGGTTETITWVLTSYIIASAVALPITGWLADRVGARQLFIGSVAGFILSSMLCGMAQNLTEMVVFRAIQGVTGAFIAPLSQAFMLDTNKPSKHAQMMALWGMGIMIGPILGPVLGGWLTEQANWRWVFYVNLPVGILSLAILITQLPHREIVRRRFDLAGFALLGIALASFQMLLDRGQTLDWFDSMEIWLWTFLFVSASWMAVIHLATARDGLFDRDLFTDRNFAIAMGFMLAIGVVMFATMALLPPMLQQLMGYDVIDTGLVLMPRGIGVLISMQIAGMLMRRGVDARPVVATGFIICAISLWEMSQWSLGVDRFHIVSSGLVQGLGMGLVFIPLNVSAFATLPPRLRTDGSSLLNLFRSLGASAGISLTTVMLARNIQTSHADIASNITGASLANSVDVSTIDRYQNLGEAALRMIDAEVNRQAAMIAYVDDFRMMMWMTLAAVPLAFIMRRTNAGPRPLPPPGE
ncbi:DHA2 family efflux MFS transporter permease subunit [Qipengyuania zhejiangensis]|uniref:DHA2 family efflux MFS transporter permease subunit n=1 Tax=Qipengyuania zhejiangensis TaxID=3077782 RepID=UPI002D7753B2|nr:DHA2 family efflux MFS transporter permease subunit [Qipengyuania sp. Z2]